jgi:pimeloyl-ACP methyl ester carboxylesterase
MATMELTERVVGDVRVRCAERATPRGGGGATVLLTSPWPESLLAWDAMWSRLAPLGRLVAIDLPGFGRSERRPELMAPDAMGDFLNTLVDAWGLAPVHVVAPDVGTSAALFAVVRRPELYATAVVGTGAASVPLDVAGALEDILAAPDLSGYRAVDGRDVVAGALELLESYMLPADVREDYLASYAGTAFAESCAYVRTYPETLPRLAELLPSVQTPVRVITGARDPIVPPANGEFLAARLPDSTLDVLAGGHFLWEDQAEGYAGLVADWITSHPAP